MSALESNKNLGKKIFITAIKFCLRNDTVPYLISNNL